MLSDVGNALACTFCVCLWGAKCTDLPGSLALSLGHVHTLDVVYVRGGEGGRGKCTGLPGSLALALGHFHMLDVVYARGG